MTTLKKGDKAPDFLGYDQDGNVHKLTDYLGQKLVIFFYPKANTPGCTAEASNLAANYEQFKSRNYAILGISADDPKTQMKFKEKFNLPFPLIADQDKTIINAYGVWGPKKFMGREYDGILRTTFIIDENGYIQEVISDVKTKNHTEQIFSYSS